MTDIVEQLRDVEHGASVKLQLEAADEIERLREEAAAAYGKGWDDGIEEAAEVADRYWDNVADAIRALKGKVEP